MAAAMSYEHTSAFGALAYVLVLVVIYFGPGLAVGWLLRLRGIALVALAPVFGVTTVSVGGLLAPRLGLRWSPAVLLLCCAVALVVAAGCGRLLRAPVRRDRPSVALGGLAGAAVGALTVVVSFRRAMGPIRWVPSQPDVPYHLSQLRYMLGTGDISSLTASGVLYDPGVKGRFYPSAWHDMAVTALQVVKIEIPIAANLQAMLVAGVVWTIGCVLLARQAFGAHGATLAVAGVASASFAALPYAVSAYGTLWPNALGFALVPGLLACVVSLLGLADDDALGRGPAAVTLVLGLPGAVLAHPNGPATVAVFTFGILVLQAPRYAVQHRRERPGLVAAVIGGIVAFPILWWLAFKVPRIHVLLHYFNHPPDESKPRLLSELLLNNPRYGAPLWVASVFVLVGLVVLVRRRLLWPIAVWLVGWALFFGVANQQTSLTRSVTSLWYNNAPRLAAMTVFGCYLLLTAGFVAVSHWLHRGVVRWLARRPDLRARPGRRLPVALTGVLLAAYVVGTGGNYVREHADRMHPYLYNYRPRDILLTTREYHALIALAPHVPPTATLALNPWRGMSLIYALTGRQTIYRSHTGVNTPDRLLIARQLYLAADPGHPEVCAALARTHVTYVITGGSNFMPDHAGVTTFPGVDRVPGRPGFTQVATAAPYTLWKITACRS